MGGAHDVQVGDAAYNPLSYHNGTVWPHDTSLAAWGLARYGRWARRAHGSSLALLEAARHFGCSLPEVFAGFDRSETPFPIAYPTAARPQAWAAGTPDPPAAAPARAGAGHRAAARSERSRGPSPFSGMGIILEGVRALGRPWDVSCGAGASSIELAA